MTVFKTCIRSGQKISDGDVPIIPVTDFWPERIQVLNTVWFVFLGLAATIGS